MIVEEKGPGVYAISDINKVAQYLCESYLFDDDSPTAMHIGDGGQLVPKGARQPRFKLYELYDTIRWSQRKGRPVRVIMFSLIFHPKDQDGQDQYDEPVDAAKQMMGYIHTGRLFINHWEYRERKQYVLGKLKKYEHQRREWVKSRGESDVSCFGTSYGWVILEDDDEFEKAVRV